MRIATALVVVALLVLVDVAAGGGAKKGVVVDLGGLKSETPADWKAEKPASKFRLYQFSLPGDDKDANLAVFYFDGGGGGLEANLQRWKDKVIPPKGKSIDEASKIEKFKVGVVDVTYLDASGTYLDSPPGKPKADAVRRENYRFLGIYFNHENGPHFITVTGPARAVEKHKKAIDSWLKAFK